MKNNLTLLLLSFCLLVGLVACNNTNLYYTGGGTQCAPVGKAGAFPSNLGSTPGYSTALWQDLTSSTAQTGAFTYTGSTVYFYDDTAKFEIEIGEGQNADSVTGYSSAIDCVENFANVAALPSKTLANQLMNGLKYSSTSGNWTATAESLSVTLVAEQFITSVAAVALPSGGVSADPQSVFTDYSSASTGNDLEIWCIGTCLSTQITKAYVIRGSKTSTKAPFDVQDLSTTYSWTASPTSAVATLNLGQILNLNQ